MKPIPVMGKHFVEYVCSACAAEPPKRVPDEPPARITSIAVESWAQAQDKGWRQTRHPDFSPDGHTVFLCPTHSRELQAKQGFKPRIILSIPDLPEETVRRIMWESIDQTTNTGHIDADTGTPCPPIESTL